MLQSGVLWMGQPRHAEQQRVSDCDRSMVNRPVSQPIRNCAAQHWRWCLQVVDAFLVGVQVGRPADYDKEKMQTPPGFSPERCADANKPRQQQLCAPMSVLVQGSQLASSMLHPSPAAAQPVRLSRTPCQLPPPPRMLPAPLLSRQAPASRRLLCRTPCRRCSTTRHHGRVASH